MRGGVENFAVLHHHRTHGDFAGAGGFLCFGEGRAHEVEVVRREVLGHGGIVVVRAITRVGCLRLAALPRGGAGLKTGVPEPASREGLSEGRRERNRLLRYLCAVRPPLAGGADRRSAFPSLRPVKAFRKGAESGTICSGTCARFRPPVAGGAGPHQEN